MSGEARGIPDNDPDYPQNGQSKINPFAAPQSTSNERGVFGNARRIRSGFLFRVIEFESSPIEHLVYDGWWFRQKVKIDGVRLWQIVSWLTIRRQIEISLPASGSRNSATLRIEIDFGRSLLIRRFRVWIDENLLYDEIN